MNNYILGFFLNLPINNGNPVKQREDQFPQKNISSMVTTSSKFQLPGSLVWRFQSAIAVS